MTDNNSNNDSQELVLNEVVEVTPEELSDGQKTFLQENVDELSDEQKETYKDALAKEEEKVDPEKIKVETRTKIEKEKKVKSDEEEEVDPEDEATIKRVVDRSLKEAGVGATRDQLETDAFLRSKPEYEKYRGVILKHLAHPDYKNIPVHHLAAMVSSNDQQKIGAQKEREAAKKAKDTQGGGSTVRKPISGKTDWSKATTEEMDAKKAEIFDRRA